MAENTKSPASAGARSNYRWVQLVIGIICMILIANCQYGWTLFVQPMAQ